MLISVVTLFILVIDENGKVGILKAGHSSTRTGGYSLGENSKCPRSSFKDEDTDTRLKIEELEKDKDEEDVKQIEKELEKEEEPYQPTQEPPPSLVEDELLKAGSFSVSPTIGW